MEYPYRYFCDVLLWGPKPSSRSHSLHVGKPRAVSFAYAVCSQNFGATLNEPRPSSPQSETARKGIVLSLHFGSL